MGDAARITSLVESGLAMMLAGLKQIEHGDEWVDQAHSPIGRLAHLEAVRTGRVKGCKVGKRVLVRKADLDDFIEKHRVHTVTVDEELEEKAEVERLLNDKPKPRRRRTA